MYLSLSKNIISFVKMYRVMLSAAMMVAAATAGADTIPDSSIRWKVGVEAGAFGVPGTNAYLRGDNMAGKSVSAGFGGALRADFSFDENSRTGRLYRGAYQGAGIDVQTFSAGGLLGSPVSLYVYQGAPIASFTDRLWLGYEWQFGAALGWKHYRKDTDEDNIAIGSSATARLGVSLKLHYRISQRWIASAAVTASHYSNGNTSWPNRGVNTVGASVGVAYLINPALPADSDSRQPAAVDETDRPGWFYDITVYGAWRSRGITINETPQLIPGKFGIGGLQFAPMRRFNRMFAAGVSLDLQYDESAGLSPYHVEGSVGDDIKFYRPPFGKQLSAGISAHAELIMPIFALNAGLGYDIISPEGEQRFYQSLTLKTFVYRGFYINTGYRLGKFKDPQNLMLGIGIRL